MGGRHTLIIFPCNEGGIGIKDREVLFQITVSAIGIELFVSVIFRQAVLGSEPAKVF